jgi:hypothetical protein
LFVPTPSWMRADITEMPNSSIETTPASNPKTQLPGATINRDTEFFFVSNANNASAMSHVLQDQKNDVLQSNITPGVGSGMSSSQLRDRNSQTGPHRCERINPTTGKPCNIYFSRPYELTHHEDTIHNTRRLKLQCALCTVEKLFSRKDALTRHLRVAHPEVEFPGRNDKGRRSGKQPRGSL